MVRATIGVKLRSIRLNHRRYIMLGRTFPPPTSVRGGRGDLTGLVLTSLRRAEVNSLMRDNPLAWCQSVSSMVRVGCRDRLIRYQHWQAHEIVDPCILYIYDMLMSSRLTNSHDQSTVVGGGG